MIAKIINTEINKLIKKAQEDGVLPNEISVSFQVEPPKVAEHGDYATNVALTLAGQVRQNPREIATWLAKYLERRDDLFSRVEVAGPGFINFFIAPVYWQQVPKQVILLGENYGQSKVGKRQRVQVEFVSANPTGPLHIGHGRGAAVGDTLARLLSFAGFHVEKEYYINDVGRQMEILGHSVYLRAKELLGEKVDFPKDYYQGDYIRDLAKELLSQRPGILSIPEDEAIEEAKIFAVKEILSGIKKDLEDFGVTYDRWFSEKTLYEDEEVEKALNFLKDKGLLYEREGALWFCSSKFGDEKDRVVIRATGEPTYFASDIAYHHHKFLTRGYDRVIDVWGADHHGYIPRLKAAIRALGISNNRLQVILIQMVNLIESGELKSMSTRAGEFVTLRELLNEVGKDATRFTFLTRRADSPLDFDVDLARRQSQENPVYYVQYAHARLASIFRKAAQAGVYLLPLSQIDLSRLDQPEDFVLLKLLDYFPDVVEAAALKLEPHRLTFYLLELATAFHNYYARHRFLSDDQSLTQARLCLAKAVKQVVAKGLWLLGVFAPEKM